MKIKQNNFKTGVFCNQNIDTTNLITSHLTTNTNNQEKIIQINIKNIGQDTAINSVYIDFEISNFNLQEILQNGWGQSSFSGYINKITPTKKNNIILVRDQNPYSFKKNFGYIPKSQISEWYTQLVSSKTALIIGAVTTQNQYTSIYIINQNNKILIRVACQFDGIIIKKNQTLYSEKIYLGFETKEKSLENFANLLKKYSHIDKVKTPVKGLCCAYYYQGNKVNEKYILEQLDAIDRLPVKTRLNLIQIDAGYCLWGDWLDTDKRFPSGMKYIVSEINKRGLKAGIWIAPFVASFNSKLYQKHPEWFIKTNSLVSGSLKTLDITHPEVQKHITKVFQIIISWGFEYIKTDFTHTLGFTTDYYQKMTRAQALHLGFKTIKKAINSKALMQSSITQLSPLVGLTDYARVGIDSINPFLCNIPIIGNKVNNWMLSSNIQNCQARQFYNNKIWVNDADCFICRPNTGHSPEVINKHFQFINKYGGSVWCGDNLAKLPWERYEKYLLNLFGYQNTKETSISIVIPGYNEEKTISLTLDSISKQQTKIPYEVIFVNNNCTDNTVNIVKSYSKKINNLHIVNEKVQSIGAARNAGFNAAKSKLILSTDSDTISPTNWVSSIYSKFWKDEKIGALNGTYIFLSKSKLFNLVTRYLLIFSDLAHKLFTGSYAFRGSNFAIKKTIWDKAGKFNPTISALEDVDLSIRVRKIAKIIYLPNLVVKTSYRRFNNKKLFKSFISKLKSYVSRTFLKNSSNGDLESIR